MIFAKRSLTVYANFAEENPGKLYDFMGEEFPTGGRWCRQGWLFREG
jgi:hypothetical protein